VPDNIPEHYEDEDAISLIDLLLVFARHKLKIIVVPFLVGCVVAAYSLTLPEIYTASATIVPSKGGQPSALALISNISGLSGVGGGGVTDNSHLTVTMLKSRRVMDRVIDIHEINIDAAGKERPMEESRIDLSDSTKIELGRNDGVITISIENKDPEKAAAIANQYITELEILSRGLALSEASHRRLFIERQMKESSKRLQDAEESMRNSQEQSGLIHLDEQGRSIIQAIARIQGEITAKQVELSSLKLSATDENPLVKNAEAVIDELRSQLASFEEKVPEKPEGVPLIFSSARVPEVGLQYARRLRDLKYAETIHQSLTKQYQVAKLDEAQNANLFSVLDKAIPPVKRTRPMRRTMVLVSMFSTCLVVILMAFLLEVKHKAEENPEQAGKMADLKKSLWSI
jgi:uncharacterized protein involved in exopolysaccharide biosynthesis